MLLYDSIAFNPETAEEDYQAYLRQDKIQEAEHLATKASLWYSQLAGQLDKAPDRQTQAGFERHHAAFDAGVVWDKRRYDHRTSTYTTAQAAERLGISQVRVQQLVRERNMDAPFGQRIGHILVLTAEEIDSLRERRTPGRPPKQD